MPCPNVVSTRLHAASCVAGMRVCQSSADTRLVIDAGGQSTSYLPGLAILPAADERARLNGAVTTTVGRIELGPGRGRRHNPRPGNPLSILACLFEEHHGSRDYSTAVI